MQSRLRLMDLDDLIVLRALYNNFKVGQVAGILGVTQPAVTQRLRKLEFIFDGPIITKVGREIYLNRRGMVVCVSAVKSLEVLEDIYLDLPNSDYEGNREA